MSARSPSHTAQSHVAMELARFWLDEAILRLPRHMPRRYHKVTRGQYCGRFAERLNVTPAELDRYLVRNAISDDAHRDASQLTCA
jgi:DNA sulfur modification protein DndC